MDEFSIGRFRVTLEFREVQNDRGVSLKVFGPVNRNTEEILRFDCFEKVPHYHTAFSYRKDPLVPIDAPDPFGWVIGMLKADMNILLLQSSAEEMNQTELDAWAESIVQIEKAGRKIADAA